MSETDARTVHRIRNVIERGRRDNRAGSVVLLQIVKILEDGATHWPSCNDRCNESGHWLAPDEPAREPESDGRKGGAA